MHAWSTPTNAQTRFLRLFLRKFATAAAPAAGKDAAAAQTAALAGRTLLASVATAGYAPTTPYSTATKAIPAPGKKGAIRRSILRTESEESGVSDFGHGEAVEGAADAEEASVAPSVTPSAAAGRASNAGPAAYPIKKWIRLSRVVYGVPYVSYSEN
jgi:hypothetical protein